MLARPLTMVALVPVASLAAWVALRPPAPPTGPVSQVPSSPTASTPTELQARVQTAFTSDDRIFDVALSADGTQLCFSDNEGLWVQPLGGGPRRAVNVPRGSHDPLRSLFFPDGQRLLVVAGSPGHQTTWIAPLDGSAPERQAERFANVLDLSRDGTRAVIAGEQTIDVADLKGEGVTHLAPTLNGSWIDAARFSPDGLHVAYVDKETLRVTSIDGVSTQRVLADPRLSMDGAATLAWPSSDRLVFGARAKERGFVTLQEVLIDDAGRPQSEPRALWTGRGNGLAGLSSGGSRLAMILFDSESRIEIAPLGPGSSLSGPLVGGFAASEPIGEVRWMPDGRLAFLSRREDSHPGIYAQHPGASDLVRLVDPPVERIEQVLRTGTILYTRRTSPDLAEVRLYEKAPNQSERAVDVPAAPRIVVRCAAGEPARCVLAAPRGGAIALSRLDLTGQATTRNFVDAHCRDIASLDLAVAPSGDLVAVACQDEEIYVSDLKQGAPHAVPVSPTMTIQSLAFGPDGSSLFLTGGEGDSSGFALLSTDLKGHGRMLVDSPNRWFNEPRISPDGKTLAVYEKVFHTNVWLLEPH
jgi:WD40 repeat protein